MIEKKQCIFCKQDINQGAVICHYCHEHQNQLYKKTRFLYGLLPVIISITSLIIAILSYNYSKSISVRRNLLETLKEMQNIQDELPSKSSNEIKFSAKEILLLNYYETLSQTVAEYVNDNRILFKSAICTHENSVRLREKPHPEAEQIGGIRKGEEVTLLGTYSKDKLNVWHYVVTNKRKIGWTYKFFEEN